MKVFLPPNTKAVYVIKQRLAGNKLSGLSFSKRHRWPDSVPLNQTVLSRIHARLHYLACHSPNAVSVKWVPVYRNFQRKHEGGANMPGRYQFSAREWL